MERVSNLGYGSPGTSLNIRILRKWIPHFKKSETWFLAIDERQDPIQILAERPDQDYIEKKLLISHCYQIEDYTCSETNDHQQVLNNPYHINIGPVSSIIEIHDTDKIPKYWFCFRPTDYLHSIANSNNEFPDFIGIFNGLKDLKKSNNEPYILLSATNIDGDEMKISLWNECIDYPEKFDRVSLDNKSSTNVVAITSLKLTKSAGTLKLGSREATYVYINPAIPETAILLTSYRTGSIPIIQKSYSIITLEDLGTKEYSDLLGKLFVSRVNITDFIKKNSWYTTFCNKCPKQASKKGSDWFCTTHAIIPAPKFVYTISAVISDPTNQMTVTITDEAMTKISGISCQDLITKQNVENRKTIPSIIEACKNHSYNVHLEMMKQKTGNNVRFIVTDVTIPPTIPSNTTNNTIPPATPSTIPTNTIHNTTLITPPSATPTLSSTPTSSQPIPENPPPKDTQTKRQLTYDTTDDGTAANPSKRDRCKTRKIVP